MATLQAVYSLMRAKAKLGPTANLHVQSRESHIASINSHYKRLWLTAEWPHLNNLTFEKNIVAGSRYYDFPVALESIYGVWYYQNNRRSEVAYGIDPVRDYNSLDPDQDQRSDPVSRWQTYGLNQIQFEVWPLPLSAGVMQFRGKPAFVSLVNDADQCYLDEHMVAGYAAADHCHKDDRDVRLAEAKALFDALRGRGSKAKTFSLGMRRYAVEPTDVRRSVVVVRVES